MKVSIIIPTYNRVSLLKEALDSIASQTYDDFEVIVVNDFPEQKAEVSKLVAKYQKVHLISQSFSKGGNAARNAGITFATGDIIAFLDDDDTWYAEKLSKHVEAHKENPEVGLVYSNCEYFWENGVLNDQVFPATLPDNVILEMKNGKFCPATTTAVTLRTECFKVSGQFDEDLVSFQDWDMWFRVAQNYSFILLDEPLVRFRQHFGSRVSFDIDKRLKGLDQVYNKWFDYLKETDFYKNQKQITYYKYAHQLLLNGKKQKAFECSFRLLFLRNFGNSIRLFIKLQLMMILNPKFLRNLSISNGRF